MVQIGVMGRRERERKDRWRGKMGEGSWDREMRDGRHGMFIGK